MAFAELGARSNFSFLDGASHPPTNLVACFSATGADVGNSGIEGFEQVGFRLLDRFAGHPGPAPDLEFSQFRRRAWDPADARRDRGRGLTGSQQITADQLVDRLAVRRQAPRATARLLETEGRKRRIAMTLPATRRIPERLGMADERKSSGHHGGATIGHVTKANRA